MASNSIRRLSTAEIKADQDTLLALKELHDYQPINPAYRTERLIELATTLAQMQQEEQRLTNALAAARDNADTAAMDLHNAILGAKVQVKAQYGDSSNALQSLGLKKKSERKRPSRRSAVVLS